MNGAWLLLAVIAGGCIAGCANGPDELSRAVWGRADTPPVGVLHEFVGTRPSDACSPSTPSCVNGRFDDRYVTGAADGVGDTAAVCPDAISPSARSFARAIGMDRRPSYTTQKVAGADDPELGETLQICPLGFDLQSQPVMLTLRRSDGSEVTRRVAPNEEALASDTVGVVAFFLDRSWPRGPVIVTARQGAIVKRTTFRIVAPRHRGVRVQEWLGRPILPNPLTIMVVGQRPRSSVLVDLYRRSRAGRSLYATSFRLSTDARGIGQVRAPYTRADNGTYLLRPRSPGGSGGRDVEARVRIMVGFCESAPQQNAYCAN